jgi:hypothetical protein
MNKFRQVFILTSDTLRYDCFPKMIPILLKNSTAEQRGAPMEIRTPV